MFKVELPILYGDNHSIEEHTFYTIDYIAPCLSSHKQSFISSGGKQFTCTIPYKELKNKTDQLYKHLRTF
jgi:hypothetical protein